jgi:hypothetical protein
MIKIKQGILLILLLDIVLWTNGGYTYTHEVHEVKYKIPPLKYSMTYADVIRFVTLDKTNEHNYIWGIYNCVNFSQDLIKRARNSGFVVIGVGVGFEDTRDQITGHEFVAFYTIDRGIIWIEPQDDSEYVKFYNLPQRTWFNYEEGQRLCDTQNFCWFEKVIYWWYIPEFDINPNIF